MCPSSITNSEPGPPDDGRRGEGRVAPGGEVSTGADDGLVALRTGPETHRERRLDLAVLALFVVLLAGTGLVDGFWPLERPRLLGHELQQREKQRLAARLEDGSLARWIESEIRTRSRVRQNVLPGYALGLYQVLNEVRGDLLVGHDGWLFLRDRAQPSRQKPGPLLDRGLRKMTALADRLAGRGARLVILPIPRKSVICADRLPPGIDPRPELEPRLADALRRRGMDFVDLLPLMLQRAADGQSTFFRADSHWTEETVIASAEETARQLGRWVPPEERRTRLEITGEIPPRFDLLHFIGIRPTRRTMAWLTPERIVHRQVVDETGQPVPTLESWDADTRAVLIGTSFSALGDLASYLEHFSQHRVLDAADPGVNPFAQLRRFVAHRDQKGLPLPPVILFEIPAHYFFQDKGFAGIRPGEIVP